MAFELNFMPQPLTVLEASLEDPTRQELADAVEAVLDQLETDPGEPTLGTTNFVTEGYRHIRSTPVRRDGWVVIWQLGTTGDQLDIVFLGDPEQPSGATPS